jgi:hypothetical protein
MTAYQDVTTATQPQAVQAPERDVPLPHTSWSDRYPLIIVMERTFFMPRDRPLQSSQYSPEAPHIST